MTEYPKLMMLHSCPFCWKVRSLLEYLKIDFNEDQLNPLRRKKSLKFAGDWGKVPIWRDSEEDFVIDSTPIMLHLDKKYNPSAHEHGLLHLVAFCLNQYKVLDKVCLQLAMLYAVAVQPHVSHAQLNQLIDRF